MTAKDLLEKILEYKYMWSSPDRTNSLPATTRMAQIDCLQKAFGLTKDRINPLIQIRYAVLGQRQDLSRAQHLNKMSNLEYVLCGEFLQDREAKVNLEMNDTVLKQVISLYPEMEEYIRGKRIDLQWLFSNLINFRQEVYAVTYPTEGMLEGFSTGLHYSFYLQGKLKKAIKENLGEIDETLCLLLDPSSRTFDKNSINYPDADLDSIDLDWRIANY